MNAQTNYFDTFRDRSPLADSPAACDVVGTRLQDLAERDVTEYWKSFWLNRDDAGHRHSSESWLRFYAEELMVYFPETPVAALEIGCGNGQLYGYFADRFSSYVGLDYSPLMIDRFQRDWPNAQLICGDARCLQVFDTPFEFAFSNQVCQYLDHEALRNHLAAVRDRLCGGGSYLLANVPDRELRFLHDGGGLRSARRFSWRGALRRLQKRVRGGRDGIGHWYRRWELGRLADAGGWDCQTYSSASYEYRFHARLIKR